MMSKAAIHKALKERERVVREKKRIDKIIEKGRKKP
jgi:hypothetical protein